MIIVKRRPYDTPFDQWWKIAGIDGDGGRVGKIAAIVTDEFENEWNEVRFPEGDINYFGDFSLFPADKPNPLPSPPESGFNMDDFHRPYKESLSHFWQGFQKGEAKIIAPCGCSTYGYLDRPAELHPPGYFPILHTCRGAWHERYFEKHYYYRSEFEKEPVGQLVLNF